MRAVLLITLLAAFGYLEYVDGSCLSYGHSCWGGHGKRSGNQAVEPQRPNLIPRLTMAQRFARIKEQALKDDCEDGSTEGVANSEGSVSQTNCGGATKSPAKATSPKRAMAPANFQTNAEAFLEAMEAMPPSEEELGRSDDDERWNAIRAMNPSLRRFFQTTN